MNREIKFRAKRLGFKQWLYFDMTHHLSDDSGVPPDFLQYQLDIKSICQFTGLTDKNGKDIYEKDIIEFHANYCTKEKNGRGKIAVVTWNLDYMRFDLVNDEFSYDVAEETDEWHYKREIIGNIHENKNLIRER